MARYLRIEQLNLEKKVSDTMFYGVLRMPYAMAMKREISRQQFYGRAQEAADRVEKLEKQVQDLQSKLSTNTTLSRDTALAMAKEFERLRKDQRYSLVDAMLQAIQQPGVKVFVSE